MIYLDNHRMARPSLKVLQKIHLFSQRLWCDPAAPYCNDLDIIEELKRAFHQICDLVGSAEQFRCILTHGEEDAAYQVFQRVYATKIYPSMERNLLLAPVTENAALRKAMETFVNIGCSVDYLPVNENGQLTPAILEDRLSSKACLLALSWANPLTGVTQPIWEIARFCKERGILLYLQGSDMVGKLFVRLEDYAVDFFSCSADRFHGPMGIGALFLREESSPFTLTGFQNLPGLIGMGAAAQEVIDFMDEMATEIAYLRSLFEEGLLKQIPCVEFFGKGVHRLPNVSCFAIPGIHAEWLTFSLSRRGLFVSYGGGGVQKLEYLLSAAGVETSLAKSAISIALSMENSEAEVQRAVEIIAETVADLQKIAFSTGVL